MTAGSPAPGMLAVAERIARYIETLDPAEIKGAFADHDVTIIENFAPYRFDGPAAVDTWSAGMTAHRKETFNLRHVFGDPIDFSETGHQAYFSLPTTWTGTFRDRPFTETGGWAFVLIKHGETWRVQSYGWAVTSLTVQ